MTWSGPHVIIREIKWSRSVVSDSLLPHGLWPSRLLCSWDFPGKNTGVGCHFFLQGIFMTQGLINVACLNHPKPICRPRSMENLSSMKLVSGAQNVGHRCPWWPPDALDQEWPPSVMSVSQDENCVSLLVLMNERLLCENRCSFRSGPECSDEQLWTCAWFIGLPSSHTSVNILVVIQSLSRVRLSVTPWTAACQASLSITNSWSLLKIMSIELVMPSNHLILCRPLLPPSIFPSIRVFPLSQLFASGGQRIGASASASVLPMNSQGWFPLGWTGLMSLLSKGLSRVFSSTTIWMHQLFGGQFSFYFFLTVSMKRQKNRSIRNHLFSCLGWFGIEFACPANPLLSWKIILWAKYAPNSGKLRFSFCDFAGMSKTQINIMWKWKSLSHVRLCATPWTIQSMEFSRPEYWSG